MRNPRQHRYPKDLSDAEWVALEPLLPPPTSNGRPLKWPRRLMVEAVFYLVRSGCASRMLPSSFPPWPTVFTQFRSWRIDGTLRRMHDRLRALAREAAGRNAEPSAAIIDSQTARATGVGGPARGYDAAKRTAGRKRYILVHSAGLVLLAHVHAANLHDRLDAQALIGQASPGELPRLELVWADGAYAGTFARWLEAGRGWRVEVSKHRDRHLWRYGLAGKPEGFQGIPRQWVVERTFAWLSRSRRLARDYERLPATAEAMIHAAMSRIMLQLIAA
ncbi:IS5 family transposase [Belnapia sp. F-4-1]|uniref:IS5 family transposase n=1 Tax=Belnapia sp. F-4-1 TaxID=1545443 RepID=UPI00068DABC7|nr:IS5 family transposase [Belnapia sp. F-4-1]